MELHGGISERLLAGIALVFVAPVAAWGLFVAGLLLGSSGGTAMVPAAFLTAPTYLVYRLARVLFPRRTAEPGA